MQLLSFVFGETKQTFSVSNPTHNLIWICIKRGGSVQRGMRNLQPASAPKKSRLTGVSRIEAVFRAHVGDDRKILAASDQTDDG